MDSRAEMAISTDAEKNAKNQHTFMKNLEETRNEKNYLYIIKVIYNICETNIILSWKKTKYLQQNWHRDKDVHFVNSLNSNKTRERDKNDNNGKERSKKHSYLQMVYVSCM